MVTKWRGLPGCSTRPTNRMNRKGGFPLRSGLVAYVERRSAIGATLPLAVVPAKDACRPPAAIRQPRHEGPLWVISVGFDMSATCPVKSQSRTWFAVSHKRAEPVCVAGVTSVSWDQQFDDPIVLPGRKPLVTLRDAALYITKLPKAEHDTPEWLAAMQALLLVAERNGPTMLARIGMMWAINRLETKPTQAPRKPARACRIVR
jgi:hypothetical protein